MPLLDHFRPPLYPRHRWESFHSNWATRIADQIAAQLPPDFMVEEHTHAGTGMEIDVATFEDQLSEGDAARNGTATLAALWTPPRATLTLPLTFSGTFEVLIFLTVGGPTLVAAIELISPRNKDRRAARQAFGNKCASYLHEGVSLILIDIVTTRSANLHNELMELLGMEPTSHLPATTGFYAAAYRPVLREQREEMDVWTTTFNLGDPLPTMPLRLTGDLFLPIDFEAAYTEACRQRRL